MTLSLCRKIVAWVAAFLLMCKGGGAAAGDAAADSINATGLALHKQSPARSGNALLSPWSIQSVMTMVLAGADGKTKKELEAGLHASDTIHPAQKAFSAGLLEGLPKGAELRTANRLFPDVSCDLLPAFNETITQNYGAAVEPLDFSAPAKATEHINGWVGKQTGGKIINLIPAGALDRGTRLVLTNAVYFNMPWQERFTKELTSDQPFWVTSATQKTVPLMFKQSPMRYAKKNGFQMAALPYSGGRLQFIVIVPDKIDGLAAVEKSLTPALLAECASMPKADVRLSLPRFRMEPPAVELQTSLASLGMKTVFSPAADFSRMSSEPLFVSKVFHKTFIDVNENGTEAAAATAAGMAKANGHPHETPHKAVRADHPFVFAIQHVPSGACLFLGRLIDPDPSKAAAPRTPPAKKAD
jgi:serpin B